MTDTPYLTEYLNRKKMIDEIKVGSKWIMNSLWGQLPCIVLENNDSGVKVLCNDITTIILSWAYVLKSIKSGTLTVENDQV